MKFRSVCFIAAALVVGGLIGVATHDFPADGASGTRSAGPDATDAVSPNAPSGIANPLHSAPAAHRLVSQQAADLRTPAVPELPADSARRYAETMQTGVFGEEAMPQFARLFLATAGDSPGDAWTQQEAFFGSPIDRWSSEMEERLRSAFGQHVMASNARVAIMCRAAQCQLQFIERTVHVQPESQPGPASLAMLITVAREQWFRDNFVEWTIERATPVSAVVAYQLVVLPRRDPQP